MPGRLPDLLSPARLTRTPSDERTHVDDLDALIAATGPGPHDCAVGWWLRSDHPDAVSGRLALVAANLSLPLGVIADRFAARGMKNGRGGPITTQTISRHRDGRCTCPK